MPTGIYPRTKYHCQINRKGHLGLKYPNRKRLSVEQKKIISERAKRLRYNPPSRKGIKLTTEQKKYLSLYWTGKKRGKILHPDHIKPKSKYPELVFEISNVRTLCRDCHKKTDTYGCRLWKINKITLEALQSTQTGEKIASKGKVVSAVK